MRDLITFHLMALALVLSWFIFPFNGLWDSLDRHLFHALNDTIGWGMPWVRLWVFTNQHLFDRLSALCMIAIAWWLMGWRAFGKLVVAIAVVVGSACFAKFVVAPLLVEIGFNRQSPTLVLDNYVPINAFVNWTQVKFQSHHSFPGDHATVLMTWLGLLWHLVGRHSLLITLPYAVACSLPRIAVGAHWPTDILIGSATVTLIYLGWIFALQRHYKFLQPETSYFVN